MEDMVVDPAFWSGRRVLVTGHTGFKGAWLSLWLAQLGANVSGLSHAPSTSPNLFALTGLESAMASRIADINDAAAVADTLATNRPEIVFHLAAQSLVRSSFADPVTTFASNVLGVVSLLNAVRAAPSVRAVVIVTSDKCYENQEWAWGYRETDRLGGRDPYSASKGCAEIATMSMRRSFFSPDMASAHPARIATARAGNIIGGGDWSADRLVPDLVRGCLGPDRFARLRNPHSIRPWQHVLDALAAYLRIAEHLANGVDGADDAWNIGPTASASHTVGELANAFVGALGIGTVHAETGQSGPREAELLMLDSGKALVRLGWRPRMGFTATVEATARWYLAWHAGANMTAFTQEQIAAYMHTEIGTQQARSAAQGLA